ncbi:MAG: diacylglycerol kinase family protein [Patescibacteria group bacterium]|nr:diacylglycerol kinase family protein [Patescibacteria group bacterium]
MYLILVNPKANNNRYQQIERSFVKMIDQLETPYEIVLIDDLSNVEDLLEQNLKKNTTAVIAVGGNGTVNTIIDALADYDKLPLGIIPLSKNNHLADSLGITNWKQGIKLLGEHGIDTLRLGKIGEKYFTGMLQVSPKRAVIQNILTKQNWLMNFLGTNSQNIPKEDQLVGCSLEIDKDIKTQIQASSIEIQFIDEFNKKMRIKTTTISSKSPITSIFHANKININSSLSMPVIAGNDVVAKTPVEIEAISQTLPILSPITKKEPIEVE